MFCHCVRQVGTQTPDGSRRTGVYRPMPITAGYVTCSVYGILWIDQISEGMGRPWSCSAADNREVYCL